MKVGDFVIVHEGTIILKIPDIVHVEDFFRMEDVEFIAGFSKVFRKFFAIADVRKVIEDIIQFGECLLIADVEGIG
jgi:hypothetical protein